MVGAFKANPLQEICRGLGIEDLSADPRYATHEAQVAHREELQGRWRHEFGTRTTKQIIDALESVDILCGPVNDIDAALSPPNITVKTISLVDPVVHMVIDTNSQLNVLAILRAAETNQQAKPELLQWMPCSRSDCRNAA